MGDADIVVDCATPKDTQAQESGPVISQLETHDKSEDHHCPSPAGNVNDYGQQQGSLSRDVSSTQLTAEDSPVRITQFENQQRLFQILREQREYIATNQDRGDALNISHGPGMYEKMWMASAQKHCPEHLHDTFAILICE